jgi:hypothetical protein
VRWFHDATGEKDRPMNERLNLRRRNAVLLSLAAIAIVPVEILHTSDEPGQPALHAAVGNEPH